jgi:glycosyltransferase involved in cell wall biosynthesis
MIAGRGFPFLPGRGFKRHLARIVATKAYRFSLCFATGVIFQNEEDKQLFRDRHMLSPKVPATRVFGSGVELHRHKPAPLPDAPLTFLMIGRLVAHKGVFEYIEAAKCVKVTHPEVVFRLAGPIDPSPNGVSAEVLEELRSKRSVEYLGALDDVRAAIASSHVFVLPSHGGEGVPRSILEAMAAARPIVTTDTPGCRDTVAEGVNGYIVPPHNSAALAKALGRFIAAPVSIGAMGQHSLERVCDRFDVDKVNDAIGDFMNLQPAEPALARHAETQNRSPVSEAAPTASSRS